MTTLRNVQPLPWALNVLLHSGAVFPVLGTSPHARYSSLQRSQRSASTCVHSCAESDVAWIELRLPQPILVASSDVLKPVVAWSRLGFLSSAAAPPSSRQALVVELGRVPCGALQSRDPVLAGEGEGLLCIEWRLGAM